MNATDTGSLFDYLRAIRRRWMVVVGITALVTGAALVASLSSAKQYDASVEILVRDQVPINTLLDPSATFNSNDPERQVNTEVQLIKAAGTAHAAQRLLGLPRSAKQLLDQISTSASSTSDIVKLRARDRSPVLAAKIANAFADAYVQFRLQTARGHYQQAANLARQQLLALGRRDRASGTGRELQARLRELNIAAALQTGGAQIVQRASAPTSPSRPRPILSSALAAFLGLLLGAGAAVMLELVDRRFKDEAGIEDFFGLPILGGIPRPARRETAIGDHAQREAYGLLAANLRLTTPTQSSVLLVTSPGSEDGKTSVTLGLARAVAHLGLRVIAIEADLRRPTFARYATISRSGGLVGVLTGEEELASALRWVDANTLEPQSTDGHDGGSLGILAAGAIPTNPQRLLSQAGTGALLDDARLMADVVLIDTPPIGTVNDSVTLCRFVDRVVLVARLNRTTKDAGRRALRALRNLDVVVEGFVVTDAAARESYSYYPSPRARRLEAAPRAAEPHGG
jgi:succinoglycan biosynthesis transport protein ExoP